MVPEEATATSEKQEVIYTLPQTLFPRTSSAPPSLASHVRTAIPTGPYARQSLRTDAYRMADGAVAATTPLPNNDQGFIQPQFGFSTPTTGISNAGITPQAPSRRQSSFNGYQEDFVESTTLALQEKQGAQEVLTQAAVKVQADRKAPQEMKANENNTSTLAKPKSIGTDSEPNCFQKAILCCLGISYEVPKKDGEPVPIDENGQTGSPTQPGGGGGPNKKQADEPPSGQPVEEVKHERFSTAEIKSLQTQLAREGLRTWLYTVAARVQARYELAGLVLREEITVDAMRLVPVDERKRLSDTQRETQTITGEGKFIELVTPAISLLEHRLSMCMHS